MYLLHADKLNLWCTCRVPILPRTLRVLKKRFCRVFSAYSILSKVYYSQIVRVHKVYGLQTVALVRSMYTECTPHIRQRSSREASFCRVQNLWCTCRVNLFFRVKFAAALVFCQKCTLRVHKVYGLRTAPFCTHHVHGMYATGVRGKAFFFLP